MGEPQYLDSPRLARSHLDTGVSELISSACTIHLVFLSSCDLTLTIAMPDEPQISLALPSEESHNWLSCIAP